MGERLAINFGGEQKPAPNQQDAEKAGAEVRIVSSDRHGNQTVINDPASADKAGATSGPVKPEGVPDKFWDAEKGEVRYAEWAKSTRELEAKFTQQTQGAAGDQKPGDTSSKGDTAGEKPAASPIETASAEFVRTGTVSQETRAALHKVGVSDAMIDAQIAAANSAGAAIETAVFEHTTDKATFNKMAEWARENLDATQVALLDSGFASGNPAAAGAAAKQLADLYKANADLDPEKRVGGGGAPSGGGYRSGAEMQAAMADKRYKTDPAYRAEVAAKIASATTAGINLFA